MEFPVTPDRFTDPSFGVSGITPENGERFYVRLSAEGSRILATYLGDVRRNARRWAEDAPVSDSVTGEDGFKSWSTICKVFGNALAEGASPFANDVVHIRRP